MGKKFAISCMITTRNRVDALRRTLQRLERLDPPLEEIMVTADGCGDGTVEFLKRWQEQGALEDGREFVNVKVNEGGRGTQTGVQRSEGSRSITERRVIVNERGMGSVASRDRMMREAKGELVLTLDDDSYPIEQDCLAKVAKLFQDNPHLGIAVFPQKTDEMPETLEVEDFGSERPVASFACSAACLRVAPYRFLPGFEIIFGHMYEEPDYALQCMGNGWEVRWSPQVVVRHHWKRRGRNEMRNHQWHARNELWSTLMRCPMPQAVGVIVFRVLSQMTYAARRGPRWLLQEPVWWAQALWSVPQALRRRKPLNWKDYFHWLALKRLE